VKPMKRKIMLILLAGFLLSGIASAASLWGTYKGYSVVRITVDGVPVQVHDVPAILMDGRTMIPIYLLQQAGIQYEWDQATQTVNIVKPAQPQPQQQESGTKLTAKEIYQMSKDFVGYVAAYDWWGNVACTGSGFLVEPGYFITNYHVALCGGSGRITVNIAGKTFHNGLEGWYLFENATTDLFGSMVSTSFDSRGRPTGEVPSGYFNIVKTNLPEIGDKVYAIGSPYGLENTISEGVVSGIRTINGVVYIQHTADTEAGSSGGVLLDEEGYLIGITTAGIERTNLDFAIPLLYLKDEIDKIHRGY